MFMHVLLYVYEDKIKKGLASAVDPITIYILLIQVYSLMQC